MITTEEKVVFVAYTNPNEDISGDVPFAVCKLETTAIRLAKYQSRDGNVRKMTLVRDVGGLWYVPLLAVNVVGPTAADVVADKALSARRAAIAKVRMTGVLSEDELKLLKL